MTRGLDPLDCPAPMADLEQLLEKTSRTFALSIPLLPEPTRREVTLAYLLFRIADTFEDAAIWPAARRIQALKDFAWLLAEPSPAAARRLADGWLADPPTGHDGYLELLAETPAVLAASVALGDEAWESIRHHTRRTAYGMAGFVARANPDGELELDDLADLRAYCYVVAGIVGEMLTELFLVGREPLLALAPYLRQRAAAFGEALQLTNILKDAAFDSTEGRRFLPPDLDRRAVFAAARQDLETAAEYTLALQRAGAAAGLVEFNALPVLLAWATLDRVERHGPGSKITRPEVYAIAARLRDALDHGQPAVFFPPLDPAESERLRQTVAPEPVSSAIP